MTTLDLTTAPPAGAVPVVRRALPGDLEALAVLFDAYRGYYEQPSDPALARQFLAERLERGEAIVFVAPGVDGQGLDGFCLLYPTFCSVVARPFRWFNDLFVRPEARDRGLASALMQAAEDDSRQAGCARLDLQTAHDNLRAQGLYEARGWQMDAVFRVYSLAL
ncbi:MAG TPA: GNAT family N-acetyltransferase [Ideonella sp.]|uniref:GNAT family N-acetyltransferase n=1 Tax=Ideonella sp. TaxID=1929293 RepID=UPI002E36AFFF|nr:GNAT family N-acetyltransferase [Ideonella sp.]HEX5682617.1 GNAT family N-acetyltransferase [Ideonella sp.]